MYLGREKRYLVSGKENQIRMLACRDSTSPTSDHYSRLLFNDNFDLVRSRFDDIDYLKKELGVGRLGQPALPKRLWVAGRPVPPHKTLGYLFKYLTNLAAAGVDSTNRIYPDPSL